MLTNDRYEVVAYLWNGSCQLFDLFHYGSCLLQGVFKMNGFDRLWITRIKDSVDSERAWNIFTGGIVKKKPRIIKLFPSSLRIYIQSSLAEQFFLFIFTRLLVCRFIYRVTPFILHLLKLWHISHAFFNFHLHLSDRNLDNPSPGNIQITEIRCNRNWGILRL